MEPGLGGAEVTLAAPCTGDGRPAAATAAAGDPTAGAGNAAAAAVLPLLPGPFEPPRGPVVL
jgi:hypothetical protein